MSEGLLSIQRQGSGRCTGNTGSEWQEEAGSGERVARQRDRASEGHHCQPGRGDRTPQRKDQLELVGSEVNPFFWTENRAD